VGKRTSRLKITDLCVGAEPVAMAALISTLHVGPRGVHDSVNLLHAGLEPRLGFAAYVNRMCISTILG